MKRYLTTCLILLLVQTESARADVLTLSRAVDIALANDPVLMAMDSKIAALKTMPDQVSALPDPVLSVNAMNLPTDTFDFDQEPMTQLQMTLTQAFPYPGKRGLKREMADLAATTSEIQQADYRDALVGQVRATWWDILVSDKALEIIGQNQKLLEDFIEIARAKYAVGKGLQQDVLLAQLELNRLQDREVRVRGLRNSHEAVLNGLLNQFPDESIVVSEDSLNTGLPELQSTGQLFERALTRKKLLKVHRQLVKKADLQLNLAEQEKKPDFRLGLGYGVRQDGNTPGQDRPDFVSVMFSMNLPVYSKRKQGMQVSQRVAERATAERLLDDALRDIRSGIGRRAAEYEAGKDQSEIMRTRIIPQAEQTVQSMLAGYQVNQVDFLNVINGQLMLYDARISYWQALGKAKRALAKLAATVGEETLYE
ncbi:MAG: TolC family protein [Gammaproteobacteria bacterium]|jgi:outer membrane protein, heavy metal efflux system|nr:TolC family protein [Gammaproteobacteria bacterium]MBT7371408.1 TolC family protein [Gammaproteobacteria bacterium]